MNNSKEYVYIYNPAQADFYLKLGLIPISVNIGIHKDVYVKFINNTKTKEVFSIWCELGKEKHK